MTPLKIALEDRLHTAESAADFLLSQPDFSSDRRHGDNQLLLHQPG